MPSPTPVPSIEESDPFYGAKNKDGKLCVTFDMSLVRLPNSDALQPDRITSLLCSRRQFSRKVSPLVFPLQVM